MRIALLTDDVAENKISNYTEETEEAKLQRHIRIIRQHDRDNEEAYV